MQKTVLVIVALCGLVKLQAQSCTTLGQTPSTAFPVCATTTFHQSNVPICATNDLFVPGCTGSGNALYQNKNPFWYKFTCYTSGTLGFLITPNDLGDDYDWQLYDITGRNPTDVFTVTSIIVSGNWSGSSGTTGASASGVNFLQCGSDPAANAPTFAQMPNLIQGHEYLLMISHFTDSQSGYSLSFGGGTASITDPNMPHFASVKLDCTGNILRLKLNKKIRCNSLSANGSDFGLLPASSSIVSAIATGCTASFDMDSVIITLNNPLPAGTYQLVMKDGSDGNTLLDNCGNSIPVGEQIAFQYILPQPILADSVGKVLCSSDSVVVYYPKKINCASITPSGSDFSISGPTPVTIAGASGACVNGQTDYVILKLAAPIYTKGVYTVAIKPGLDGSPIYDVCGQPILPQTLSFVTVDTVSAIFNYSTRPGCLQDTLTFVHDGAHDVNEWIWSLNGVVKATATPTYTVIFPATSTNTVSLSISNGTCNASGSYIVALNNEVRAIFTMPDILCPEDQLLVNNTSKGQIDNWKWNFDVFSTSFVKDPPAFTLPPNNNREIYLTVKLTVANNTIRCMDSTKHSVRILNNCFIAVPTAFTPNNDGLNDYFAPNNALKADNLEFKVFNRWGQMVFRSTNWLQRWDGKVNGVLQGGGVYVWMLSYTNRDTKQPVFQKGTVTLIR